MEASLIDHTCKSKLLFAPHNLLWDLYFSKTFIGFFIFAE